MPQSQSPQRILMGITGATGAIYADRLLSVLVERGLRVGLIATKPGCQVVRFELGMDSLLAQCLFKKRLSPSNVVTFSNDDFFSPVASGSSAPDAMVIIPCSMGTMSRIAQGSSTCLLERAADVVLKERRPLLISPRETPFGLIHLRNMTALAESGAVIMPAAPDFYHHPKSVIEIVDLFVGKILEQLGINHTLYEPWAEDRCSARGANSSLEGHLSS